MGGEGCGEHAGAFVADGVGGAVVDVGGNVQAEAGVAVRRDQAKNVWQCCRAASMEANRVGKSGRYFSVLNCGSEYGLMLL